MIHERRLSGIGRCFFKNLALVPEVSSGQLLHCGKFIRISFIASIGFRSIRWRATA
jgi:hypothetical protein